MSLSTRTLVLATVAAVAAGSIGYAVVTRDGDRSDRSATVVAAPVDDVEAVRVDDAAHAALTVSNRFFQRSRVAVLTSDDESARTEAIATGKRLRVPVLLDDPAAPAELARLRSRTVLTFGDVEDVVGAVPITGSSDAERNQQVTRAVGDDASAPADDLDALVLLQDAPDHPVAAATAGAAGARVVEIGDEDLRSDGSVAQIVAAAPDAAVLALGQDVDPDLAYAISVVRADATQIGGGYLAFRGRSFVGVSVDEWGTDEAVALLRDAVTGEAGRVIVPMLQVTTTDPEVAEPVVRAAEAADAYTTIGIPADNAVQVAQRFEDLLSRPHVGLSVEGGSADTIEELAAWLADLTRRDDLPQKVLLVRTPAEAADADWIDDLADPGPELAVALQVEVSPDDPGRVDLVRAFERVVPSRLSLGWVNIVTDGRPRLPSAGTWGRLDPVPAVVSYSED